MSLQRILLYAVTSYELNPEALSCHVHGNTEMTFQIECEEETPVQDYLENSQDLVAHPLAIGVPTSGSATRKWTGRGCVMLNSKDMLTNSKVTGFYILC